MKRSYHPDAAAPYVLYTPDDIDPKQPLPLIVFLHGRGESGTDLELVRKWGIPKYLDAGHELAAIVYAPQCPDVVIWTASADKVIAGIDALQKQYAISKVHITGFSMGGHGTHYLAIKYPKYFTAIAPVATYMYPEADITDAVCVLKDKPFWIFHSEADFVPVAHSDNVVEKLRGCDSANLTYTRYDEPDHTQTADLAYLNQEFYQWLLKW